MCASHLPRHSCRCTAHSAAPRSHVTLTLTLTLAQAYAKAGKHSKPPVSLHGQLLWREFYYVCGHGTPHFDRVQGNPICKQIAWESDAALLGATFPRGAPHQLQRLTSGGMRRISTSISTLLDRDISVDLDATAPLAL